MPLLLKIKSIIKKNYNIMLHSFWEVRKHFSRILILRIEKKQNGSAEEFIHINICFLIPLDSLQG